MEIAVATIIGALIAVAGTILVNWLGNRKGYKDIDRKIGQLDNTTLSGEHSKIINDIIHTIEDSSENLNNTINKKSAFLIIQRSSVKIMILSKRSMIYLSS